jgi:hypothetical protein
VTVVSATKLTCTFPLTGKPAGVYNVVISNPDGQQAMLVNGFTITFQNPAPAITGITPGSGLNSTSVSITNLAGTGFYGTPTVKLNRTGYSDITATAVTVVSATKLTCTFPLTGKPAGVYNVVISNPDGQQAMLVNGFTVTFQNPAPAITGITPNSGPTKENTPITIRGTNFVSGGLFGVKIGGVAATNVSWINATTITAKTPIGSAGASTVVVTNNDGQTATLAGGFTYVAPPTITSITPRSGPTKENTPITIRGTNFVSGGLFGVKIGGVAATSVSWINATTITAKTPMGSAGASTVVVTSKDGQTATLAGGFTYVAFPTISIDPPATYATPTAISGIMPNSGPTKG